MKYTDAQIISWLSDCSKIDRTGVDCGYAFERTLMTDDPVGSVDVRIAVRGMEGIDGLRKQACVAMEADACMGENPSLRKPKLIDWGEGVKMQARKKR
jgi:hypothetical protein